MTLWKMWVLWYRLGSSRVTHDREVVWENENENKEQQEQWSGGEVGGVGGLMGGGG